MRANILIFFVILLIPNVAAMKDYYPSNSCEDIAQDFQKEHGGSLVWIQPLKDNGAYEFGQYNAHVLNYFYIEGKTQFYDYSTRNIFESKKDLQEWYKLMNGKNTEVWILSEERPSFGLIWN